MPLTIQTPTNAAIKEGVELYIYSSSGLFVASSVCELYRFILHLLDLNFTTDPNILRLCGFLDLCTLKLRVCIPLET